MTGDLFSGGFAWDDADVSQLDATPVATAAQEPAGPAETPHKDPRPHSVAAVASVAETEGQRLERLVSQPIVAGPATAAATLETAVSCGVRPVDAPGVAPVAAIADPALPTAWSRALRGLEDRPTPRSAASDRWEQIVQDARNVTGPWRGMVVASGWSVVQIFGFDPEGGDYGLVVALRGRRLTNISGEFATIPTATGCEWFHPHIASDAPLLSNFDERKLIP